MWCIFPKQICSTKASIINMNKFTTQHEIPWRDVASNALHEGAIERPTLMAANRVLSSIFLLWVLVLLQCLIGVMHICVIAISEFCWSSMKWICSKHSSCLAPSGVLFTYSWLILLWRSQITATFEIGMTSTVVNVRCCGDNQKNVLGLASWATILFLFLCRRSCLGIQLWRQGR